MSVNSVGKAIRDIRQECRVKQKDLAAKLDISPSHLSLIESDKREPGVYLIMDMCKALDIKASEFFSYIEEGVGPLVMHPKIHRILSYGCHCDLPPGDEPDECVIDFRSYKDCIHAKPGMNKADCIYWREIAKKV